MIDSQVLLCCASVTSIHQTDAHASHHMTNKIYRKGLQVPVSEERDRMYQLI